MIRELIKYVNILFNVYLKKDVYVVGQNEIQVKMILTLPKQNEIPYLLTLVIHES